MPTFRICDSVSVSARNKDFYSFRAKAIRKLRRIGEEIDNLPLRERQRAIYAKSEFDIVAATYFYYVQLDKPMLNALADLDPDELEQDTAQYLNYLYNMGSGGAITHGTPQEICQAEFDMLIRLYFMASGSNPYPYWQANALQSISEHIQDPEQRDFLVKNNLPAFQYLNVEQMPLELLAGNFAQRALNIFSEYGDVYQTAGAYRTLAECYWQIKDYKSAGDCLNRALNQNRLSSRLPIWWLLSEKDSAWFILPSMISRKAITTAIFTSTCRSRADRIDSWKLVPLSWTTTPFS